MKYLGIDVSKKYFDADFGGNKVKRFQNTDHGIAEFLSVVDRTSMCVLEATGAYSWSLVLALHATNILVAMENPLKVRRYAQSCFQRAKTDRADARMLTKYGEEKQPKPFVPPPTFILQLRELLATYELFIGQRTALNNQLEALTHMPVIDASASKIVRGSIKSISRFMEQITVAMDAIIAEHCPQLFERICSLPGVGEKTARSMIALAGDWSRFTTAKAFVAFVGLVPRIFESGTSVHSAGGTIKLGNPRFRSALYMCSLSAMRHNPACRALYVRLRHKNKHKMVVQVAIMHKLARQIWAVATSNEPYNIERAHGRNLSKAA